MTPPATPRHCAHESFCKQYFPPYDNHEIPCNGKEFNTGTPCIHDTRTHPAPSAQAPPASTEPDYPTAIVRCNLANCTVQYSDDFPSVCLKKACGYLHEEKHLLYLDKSTPEEFINAELMDWIYLVGDISTPYELDFVRQFGHAFKTRDTHMRKEGAKAERERVLEPLEDLRKYANGEYKEAELSDNEREMRIHLEYENRVWEVMRSLRHGQKQERDPE